MRKVKMGQLVTLKKVCPNFFSSLFLFVFYAKRPFQNSQEIVFWSRMSKVMKVNGLENQGNLVDEPDKAKWTQMAILRYTRHYLYFTRDTATKVNVLNPTREI
jgi:hypothetical protein